MQDGDCNNRFGWLGHKYGQPPSLRMLTVFQIGEDRLLLETRRRVLESMGLSVVMAEGAVETLWRTPNRKFDLALLCHSLNSHRRQQIAAALRRANAGAPILLVGRGCGEQVKDGDADLDGVIDPDPERLTEMLRRLLQLKQRQVASRNETVPEAAD